MKVATVDQRDLDRGTTQLANGLQAAEPTADDNDVVAIARGGPPELGNGWSR
jgi:hypothetical protein